MFTLILKKECPYQMSIQLLLDWAGDACWSVDLQLLGLPPDGMCSNHFSTYIYVGCKLFQI